MKTIAVADLGEFYYADYKEPLRAFEGGYGYVGALLIGKGDLKLLCNYCGKTYDNLGAHVWQKHGLTAADYKREVGLLQKSALVTERVRVAKVRQGLRNRSHMREIQKKSYTKADRRTVQPSGYDNGMWAEEKLNLHGRCRDQALEAARSILREGHRLTKERLAAHGINKRVIERYFVSLDALRAELGQPPGKVAKYDKAVLLGMLRRLASELGRTPAISDLERYRLPTNVTYAKHFGSYTEACRRAGLDPNLPVPDGRDLDLAILTAYATTGRLRDVSVSVEVSVGRIQRTLARYGYPYPAFYRGPGRREWAADMARRLSGEEEIAA